MVPSTSLEPEPSKLTGEPAVPVYGPLASATGASLTSFTVIVTVATLESS